MWLSPLPCQSLLQPLPLQLQMQRRCSIVTKGSVLFNFNILFAVHIEPTKDCRFSFAFANNCDVVATDLRQESIIFHGNAHHYMIPLSYFNFDRILPRAFVSF